MCEEVCALCECECASGLPKWFEKRGAAEAKAEQSCKGQKGGRTGSVMEGGRGATWPQESICVGEGQLGCRSNCLFGPERVKGGFREKSESIGE